MHAVGFFHEQSRTDRDDHITIMWNNIQAGMQGQFEKYGHGTIQSLGTGYDYGSIMHYGTKAFSRNGQPTMIPKKNGATIGQRNGFSKVDKFKINTLYGCPVGMFTSILINLFKKLNVTFSEGEKPTTSAPTSGPIVITVKPVVITTGKPPVIQTVSPAVPLKPSECRNLRGDCDDLAKQGSLKINFEKNLKMCFFFRMVHQKSRLDACQLPNFMWNVHSNQGNSEAICPNYDPSCDYNRQT